MNNRSLVGALAIIILGGVVWYAVSLNKTAGDQPPPDAATAYSWKITDAGTSPTDAAMPRTSVTLIAPTKSYDIGTYNGSCSEIQGSSWKLLDGELSGVICWYAGGGNEVGVFYEGGKTVVKEGQLDEGSAETPGMRGGFKTLLTI